MLVLHCFSDKRLSEQEETWLALEEIRRHYLTMDVYVEGAGGYDDALRSIWSRDDLLVIEQDIVPSFGQVQALERCTEAWCACKYEIRYSDDHTPSYEVTHGLGFTRFSLELQRRFPASFWYHTGNWRWQNLDCRITGLMVQSGLAPHVHGDVKHNRIADWTGKNENRGKNMEKAFGNEKVRVGAIVSLSEKAKWHAHWTIRKFVGDFPGMTPEEVMAAGVKPYETLEIDGNCLLNDGINNILTPALIGGSCTPINTTDGCIGVGNGTTAAAATQTALQGSSCQWVIVTSTSGTGSSQQLVLQASFGSSYGNFTWQEICAASTTTPGSLPSTGTTPPATAHILNRLVSSMGTKASGTTWTATLTITFS